MKLWIKFWGINQLHAPQLLLILESHPCLVISELTLSSSTSLSSSILHVTEDENILEESETGDRAIGSRAQDRDEVCRTRSETPTYEGKNRKRRRASESLNSWRD